MFQPCGQNEWEDKINGLYCSIDFDASGGHYFWEVTDPGNDTLIDNGWVHTVQEAMTECHFVADNY